MSGCSFDLEFIKESVKLMQEIKNELDKFGLCTPELVASIYTAIKQREILSDNGFSITEMIAEYIRYH